MKKGFMLVIMVMVISLFLTSCGPAFVTFEYEGVVYKMVEGDRYFQVESPNGMIERFYYEDGSLNTFRYIAGNKSNLRSYQVKSAESTKFIEFLNFGTQAEMFKTGEQRFEIFMTALSKSFELPPLR